MFSADKQIENFIMLHEKRCDLNVNKYIIDLLCQQKIILPNLPSDIEEFTDKNECKLQAKKLLAFYEEKNHKTNLAELLEFLKGLECAQLLGKINLDNTSSDIIDKELDKLLDPKCYNRVGNFLDDICNALGVKFKPQHLLRKPIGDAKFKRWRINEIQPYVYATEGPKENHLFLDHSEQVATSNLTEFFYEIFNNTNVKFIVAAGIPGEDFEAYFTPGTKTYELKDNCQITITSELYKSANLNKPSKGFQQYLLRCKIIEGQNSNENEVVLLHIPVLDGHPIQFDNDSELEEFYDKLLNALKAQQGVLVHCRAGLGRTGQIICELLALLDERIEKDFKNQESKIAKLLSQYKDSSSQDWSKFYGEMYKLFCQAMGNFISNMRQTRDFLLVKEQVYFFLKNYCKYKAIKQLKLQQTVAGIQKPTQDNNIKDENINDDFDKPTGDDVRTGDDREDALIPTGDDKLMEEPRTGDDAQPKCSSPPLEATKLFKKTSNSQDKRHSLRGNLKKIRTNHNKQAASNPSSSCENLPLGSSENLLAVAGSQPNQNNNVWWTYTKSTINTLFEKSTTTQTTCTDNPNNLAANKTNQLN